MYVLSSEQNRIQRRLIGEAGVEHVRRDNRRPDELDRESKLKLFQKVEMEGRQVWDDLTKWINYVEATNKNCDVIWLAD